MQAQPTHLAIDRLDVAFGATQVLDAVSLDVSRGEFVALLGASGCGKTTLLRTIAGFETPRSGRILLDGADITRLPPDRRGMSMVFQSYALWPHKTVDEHIAYGLGLRRVGRAETAARVAELKGMLGLEALGARKPGALSGGQRQRVALGRALAVRPDILLLDEPLSNLDARIRLQLRTEIRELQQSLGITAIHVTHDREEAMVMADRIVILSAGQIMQAGSPEEIYCRPGSSFVAAFMGAENRLLMRAVPDGDGLSIRADGFEGEIEGGRRAVSPGPLEARFRPSEARLVAAEGEGAAPGSLVADGMVTGVSYLGGAFLHTLRVGGESVQALAPAAHRVGAPARLAVPPEGLFLFPASPEGRGHETGAGPQGSRTATHPSA